MNKTEKTLSEFSSIDLLTELGKRIKDHEIVRMYTQFSSLHVRKYPKLAISSETDNEVIFKLDLDSGEIETNHGKERKLKNHE